MIKNTYSAYISILISMIFWSISFVWTKEAYESFGPVTTIFLRLVISSLLLFLFLKSTGRLAVIRKNDLWQFILLAFFEPFLYFIGESFGLKLVSSTLTSIIVSTCPLFTTVFAFLFLKEKLSVVNVIGIVVSFFGIGIMIFEKDFTLSAPLKGIALLMLAVFSTVGYSMFLKKLAYNYSPVNIIAWQNFLGIFMFLPLFMIMEVKDIRDTTIHTKSVFAIIELAIFASSLAFILFTKAIRTMGVAKSNMFINLIPVFTAIFAWIILDEKITLQKTTGIIIVITGLFISQIKKKKNAV